MKFLAVCFLLAAMATITAKKAKKPGPGFTAFADMMNSVKMDWNAGITEMLDDNTDSGLPQEAEEMLMQLKQVTLNF